MLPLFAHQVKSIEFLRNNPRVLDTSDPGTGKSRVAIEAFAERRLRGGKCALVIAPNTILRTVWQSEFRKYAPHLVTSVASADVRVKAFEAIADVYIINHDATKWLAQKDIAWFARFDTLIVDESGAFKHSTSLRTKAILKFKKRFQYRVALNGTPNPNSITELWAQVLLLDDGARLGESFYLFRNRVCTPKQVGPAASMVKWVDRPGAQEAVAKLISDITIRNVFEECVDIPPNHEYIVPYYLTPKQLKTYEEMKIAQVALLDGKIVSAINAASVVTKLLQIASGAVYDEHGHWHLVDTARYELIMDLVEERRNTVVFFLWQHQREQLIYEAKKRGITYGLIDGSVGDRDRAEAVDYFQKGLYRIMLAHPQSAAHGLTLTKGTSTIWASPTYNLEHYLQGLRRIYRAGQAEKTETITVVAQGTLEEKVAEALQNKAVHMDELLRQL